MPRFLLAVPALAFALAFAPAAAHADTSAVCVTVYSTATTTVDRCDPTNVGAGGSTEPCPTVYSPAYGAGVVVCYRLRTLPPPG